MDEANHLCDRVAIINNGKITAIDRPGNLKNMIKKLKSIEVSFNKTVNIKKLSTIPNVNEIRREGDKFIIGTDNINDLIYSVTNFAQNENLKIIKKK